ncbi:hypothetical protein Vadar_008805 [Vaccinium darrowii]|uniref:Uncharacterized protein n=1 Tax=Vaccinium darrowii TaxID=229202 RepID=A0ACB7XPD9_9ERIC|nr:hypothetical protein Vadar_008805 [Vaccinium darrowii]
MAFILNLENPFQELELQTERLFQMETEYMAAPNFFQNGDNILRGAVRRIIQRNSETPGLVHDRAVPFLALNYYDRVISRYRVQEPGFFCLFVIGCTTLAWKMRTNGFSVQQFLAARQPTFIGADDLEVRVEVRHIERAEFAILSALNWRTRSITPVCFMNFFMSLLGIEDPQQRQTLKRRVLGHQILYMHSDIRFTRFRPSIIALVGIMAERQEDRQDDFWNPVRVCEFVNLEEMENCLNLLDIVRAEDILDAAVAPQIAAPPQVPQIAAPPQAPQNDGPLQPRTPPQQE